MREKTKQKTYLKCDSTAILKFTFRETMPARKSWNVKESLMKLDIKRLWRGIQEVLFNLNME